MSTAARPPVVAISPYVPYSGIDHAGGAYLGEHVRAVAADHPLLLVAPGNEANRAVADRSLCPTHLVPVPEKPRSLLRRRWWQLRNLRQGLTPGWEVLRALTTDTVTTRALRQAGVVELHWGYLLPLLPHVRRVNPGARVLVVCHDVIGQSFRRLAWTRGHDGLGLKAGLLAGRVARQEAALLQQADCALVFSAKDRELLHAAGVTTRVEVLDPVLDHPVGPTDPGESQDVLFVAALGRPENDVSARWLLDEVWPLVRAAHPSARLVVAGSQPPAWLLARAADDVVVTGFVDDLSVLYRSAGLAIAPLTAGAGVKFKVPQAMLHGLPVVSTTIGAEGLPGAESVIGVDDSAGGFAQLVSSLLGDAQERRRQGRAAREWAQGRFPPGGAMRLVRAVYSGWA